MRKRYWVLIIISLVILTCLIIVVTLSSRNSKLKFIIDENRQVSLITQIYEEILDENIDENSTVNANNSIYINFISGGHYVISQETIIEDLLKKYEKENANIVYTLSTEFIPKDLKLIVNLNSNDKHNSYEYKLGVNKKENTIKYKLKKVTKVIID